MKIWIDTTLPAPNRDYSWRKNVDTAIELFDNHDHAVNIAMRNADACFFARDYVGRTKWYEAANRHDIDEISISKEFVESEDMTKLRNHLKDVGRLDSCQISFH